MIQCTLQERSTAPLATYTEKEWKMRRIFSVFIVSTVLLLIAACATPYQPAGSDGLGYSDWLIKDNIFHVVFTGNPNTSYQDVWMYAERRAREICAARGYADYERLFNPQADISDEGGEAPGDGHGTHAEGRVGGPSRTDRFRPKEAFDFKCIKKSK